MLLGALRRARRTVAHTQQQQQQQQHALGNTENVRSISVLRVTPGALMYTLCGSILWSILFQLQLWSVIEIWNRAWVQVLRTKSPTKSAKYHLHKSVTSFTNLYSNLLIPQRRKKTQFSVRPWNIIETSDHMCIDSGVLTSLPSHKTPISPMYRRLSPYNTWLD